MRLISVYLSAQEKVPGNTLERMDSIAADTLHGLLRDIPGDIAATTLRSDGSGKDSAIAKRKSPEFAAIIAQSVQKIDALTEQLITFLPHP